MERGRKSLVLVGMLNLDKGFIWVKLEVKRPEVHLVLQVLFAAGVFLQASISEHGSGCEDSIIIRDITDAQEEEEGTEEPLALAYVRTGNR